MLMATKTKKRVKSASKIEKWQCWYNLQGKDILLSISNSRHPLWSTTFWTHTCLISRTCKNYSDLQFNVILS